MGASFLFDRHPNYCATRRMRVWWRFGHDTASLQLKSGVLDDLAPERDLRLDHLAELLRRTAGGLRADLRQRVGHLRLLERLVDRGVEPRNHRGRRSCLGGETDPV